MKTLGDLHKIPAKQTFFPDQIKPKPYSYLWKCHSDIREITDEQAGLFSDRNQIFKQHVPPTDNNRKLLYDIKKVILLRPANEVVSAYFRGAQKRVHNVLPDFNGITTQEEFLKKAEINGLLDDLQHFYDTWQEDTGNKLIISYEDLIQSPVDTIQKIEKYWEWSLSDCNVRLAKERYSRISSTRVVWNQFFTRPKKKLLSLIKHLIRS